MAIPHTAGPPRVPAPAGRLLAELAAFAALLFVARFLARGHLVALMDQECHIGGIAVDVLAHGVRFPLLAYAPNEYDNGSFFSGLLAAGSFALLGRSVLALKLVTHLITAAGAVATLSLLRGCLDELGLTGRAPRWAAIAVLVVALALAPRTVSLLSMYAVGNHAEGAAIGAILLALSASRRRDRSATSTAALWALVGFALYLNKGTFLVLPVLGGAELLLAWRSRPRLAAAFGGFVLGLSPELLVIAQRHASGWAYMAYKAELSAASFPHAMLDSILTLGEHRGDLLTLWALSVGGGAALLIGSLRRAWRRGETSAVPVTLALVVAVTALHLVELAVMAQGGLDSYTIYGYPTLVVLGSTCVAWTCARIATRWGDAAAAWSAVAAIALTLLAYRPAVLAWELTTVSDLWRNRAGAACSWRFAEGFEREHDHGLAPPGRTRVQYAIERCRSLSEPPQILDCIGGIARELYWRQGGRVDGEPPAELSAVERRAYAYHYGTQRRGDASVCGDFVGADLAAECAAAVRLDCLVFADVYTRFFTGQVLMRPRCELAEPPMDTYWAAMRREFLARTGGSRPMIAGAAGWDADVSACAPVFDVCYGTP